MHKVTGTLSTDESIKEQGIYLSEDAITIGKNTFSIEADMEWVFSVQKGAKVRMFDGIWHFNTVKTNRVNSVQVVGSMSNTSHIMTKFKQRIELDGLTFD